MRLIGWDGLRERGITMHRVTIHRWMRAKKFPQAVKVGDWRLAWIAAEIEEWIEARAAQRNHRAA